ncbi:MAG: Glutathione-regulated potassium-efflux system protein KefB [Anaerolineales bacterium]|nr:Glutathione-regulated potassium-efflux system protein KefB [Anaerolineales bacterium]
MHEIPLLINITLALIVAFLGGVIARRVGLPTIVGYLLAGIAIGPFTPGFVGDIDTIQQLAELGVIFLMFGVGLHFSFQDLWNVRDIAIPGALIQTAFATILGFGLSQLWGWTPLAGLVLGLSISVASTVVLLRGLMDNSLLNTSHGQAAVGWLVMEDILSVLILVLMPTFAPSSGEFNLQNLATTLLKSAAFIAIMFVGGTRLLPWLLEKIAYTRSRELFILAILAITLGTAMSASELFGVSLALGAFVAGAIISQSHLSHQVGADLFSFRETFSVLFFVSVGMLVNPSFLWENIAHVISLSALVVLGKAIIVILMGFLFPRPARTFLVVAIGLSQVGEFSFILGQGGLSLNLLDNDQYSLILAAALISITANPFMYRLLPWLETQLRKIPGFWKKLDASAQILEIKKDKLVNHVVIIGYGRVGKHMVDVLEKLSVSMLIIETDAERITSLNQRGIPTLYGDASNSEVIDHARLDRASALVVTIPDETSAELIVTVARNLNPKLPIIARAATEDGLQILSDLGANRTIHPELEGGLEIVHHTLLILGYPLQEVHRYAEAVRQDRYNFSITTDEEHRSLHELLATFKDIEIVWLTLRENNSLIGKSLGEANIRARTGASVVAIMRTGQLVANPKSLTRFEAGDRVGFIGDAEQIEAVERLLNESDSTDAGVEWET